MPRHTRRKRDELYQIKICRRIHRAWNELPVPSQLWKNQGSMDPLRLGYEERYDYELFAGKRFDDFDCEKFDYEPMICFDEPAFDYYLGSALLCAFDQTRGEGISYSVDRTLEWMTRFRRRLLVTLGRQRVLLMAEAFLRLVVEYRSRNYAVTNDGGNLTDWGKLFFEIADEEALASFASIQATLAERLRAQIRETEDPLPQLPTAWKLEIELRRDMVLASAVATLTEPLPPQQLSETLQYVDEWVNQDLDADPNMAVYSQEQRELYTDYLNFWLFAGPHYDVTPPKLENRIYGT